MLSQDLNPHRLTGKSLLRIIKCVLLPAVQSASQSKHRNYMGASEPWSSFQNWALPLPLLSLPSLSKDPFSAIGSRQSAAFGGMKVLIALSMNLFLFLLLTSIFTFFWEDDWRCFTFADSDALGERIIIGNKYLYSNYYMLSSILKAWHV